MKGITQAGSEWECEDQYYEAIKEAFVRLIAQKIYEIFGASRVRNLQLEDWNFAKTIFEDNKDSLMVSLQVKFDMDWHNRMLICCDEHKFSQLYGEGVETYLKSIRFWPYNPGFDLEM